MLGKRIKELRLEKGLTLKQLGKMLNLGESTMSMYESGKRSPDYNTFFIFCIKKIGYQELP